MCPNKAINIGIKRFSKLKYNVPSVKKADVNSSITCLLDLFNTTQMNLCSQLFENFTRPFFSFHDINIMICSYSRLSMTFSFCEKIKNHFLLTFFSIDILPIVGFFVMNEKPLGMAELSVEEVRLEELETSLQQELISKLSKEQFSNQELHFSTTSLFKEFGTSIVKIGIVQQ